MLHKFFSGYGPNSSYFKIFVLHFLSVLTDDWFIVLPNSCAPRKIHEVEANSCLPWEVAHPHLGSPAYVPMGSCQGVDGELPSSGWEVAQAPRPTDRVTLLQGRGRGTRFLVFFSSKEATGCEVQSEINIHVETLVQNT